MIKTTGSMVGTAEIIDQGVILATNGEDITLDPFGEEGFKINFRLTIINEFGESITQTLMDDRENFVIELKREWNAGTPSGNVGQILIAEDESGLYYFNYIINFYGLRKSFSYALTFNIVRKSE